MLDGSSAGALLRQAQLSLPAVQSLLGTATKRCAELTKSDFLIHRSVACAVNGLVELLEKERKRVPGSILRDAERLERLVLGGYAPHFEGRNLGFVKKGNRQTGVKKHMVLRLGAWRSSPV